MVRAIGSRRGRHDRRRVQLAVVEPAARSAVAVGRLSARPDHGRAVGFSPDELYRQSGTDHSASARQWLTALCWGGMAVDERRGMACVATVSPKPNFIGVGHRG